MQFLNDLKILVDTSPTPPSPKKNIYIPKELCIFSLQNLSTYNLVALFILKLVYPVLPYSLGMPIF